MGTQAQQANDITRGQQDVILQFQKQKKKQQKKKQQKKNVFRVKAKQACVKELWSYFISLLVLNKHIIENQIKARFLFFDFQFPDEKRESTLFFLFTYIKMKKGNRIVSPFLFTYIQIKNEWPQSTRTTTEERHRKTWREVQIVFACPHQCLVHFHRSCSRLCFDMTLQIRLFCFWSSLGFCDKTFHVHG